MTRLCKGIHVVIILLFAIRSASFGQTFTPGPQVVTFFSDVDDTEQPYGLYLPKNFNPDRKYPLVIMLHGAGSNHRLALRRVFGKSNLPGETDVEATRYFPDWKEVDYIVASPYARGTMGYQGIAEKDVYDMLADVKRRFPIDEDRVYLTGLSMGGGGTLWLGLSRPDLWAALAPVCPAPPDGTAELAPNALNYPLHLFHGDADPVVAPSGVREWVKRLKELETKVEYTEYPGVGHNSWENAYQDGFIFTWFAPFQRNRHPDRVRFATSRYKYDRAYWVHIDQLTPGTLASIDAKFTAMNRLEISTFGLGAFTLHLAGHPKFTATRPVEVVIDGKKLTAKVTALLALSKREGKWVAAKYEAPANAKRPGAEGPISEVIAGRHLYVYGTADNPSPDELQARREQADHAANWSVDRGPFLRRVMVFPRVLADKEVRPSDLESSNIVLFGTKETNSLIAQFSEQLPMHFNAGAAGYGLVYVFPVGKHYFLINSGLPWWSVGGAASSANQTPLRRGFRPLYGPPGMLMDFKDYLLFKGSADNVIVEGRFDHNWRLPASDAEKMKATGAVSFPTVRNENQNCLFKNLKGASMPRRKPSKGKCAYCGAEIAKNGVSKHLSACSERQAIIKQAERKKGAVETLYHLRVQDATADADFWLDLEMRGSKTLKDLDSYLRHIWLECCGHMSQFSVGGWSGEEIPQSRKVDEVFSYENELTHIYDFGTESVTQVKVVGAREGKPTTARPIALMARNLMPESKCIECKQPASKWCMECLIEEDVWGTLCEQHAEEHEHDDYGGPIPLVNSPRLGLCGYDGPAEPPY